MNPARSSRRAHSPAWTRRAVHAAAPQRRRSARAAALRRLLGGAAVAHAPRRRAPQALAPAALRAGPPGGAAGQAQEAHARRRPGRGRSALGRVTDQRVHREAARAARARRGRRARSGRRSRRPCRRAASARSHVARAVPPVASRSSCTSTRMPCCDGVVVELEAVLAVLEGVARGHGRPGSLPGLRAIAKPTPSRIASAGPRMKPRDSAPRMMSGRMRLDALGELVDGACERLRDRPAAA